MHTEYCAPHLRAPYLLAFHYLDGKIALIFISRWKDSSHILYLDGKIALIFYI